MRADSETFHTEMAHSTERTIRVRGFDLCEELIGKVDLGDMAFLELVGRLPDERESQLLNAVLVTLVEHGVTATSIVARLLYMSDPACLQGAVAGGLLGAGSVFLGVIEEAAKMLQLAVTSEEAGRAREEVAAETVTRMREDGNRIPGLGHFLHRPEDPRTIELFALAQRLEATGPHIEMMLAIRAEADRQYGKHFPINADGGAAALLADMGFDWRVVRGFAIMSRAVGLVGHIFEEIKYPTARGVWRLVEERTRYSDPVPTG